MAYNPVTLADILDDDNEFEESGRHRTIKTETNIIHLVAEDPFGFWRIYLDRGQTPKEIADQRFTSFEEALRIVNVYMEKMKWNLIEASDNHDEDPVSRESTIPEIKFKKVRKVAETISN